MPVRGNEGDQQVKTIIAIMIVLASSLVSSAEPIPEFKSNEVLTAEKMNRIVDAVNGLSIGESKVTIGAKDLAVTSHKLYTDGGTVTVPGSPTMASVLRADGNFDLRGSANVAGKVSIGGWDVFWIWFWSMLSAASAIVTAFRIACARSARIAREEAEKVVADFMIISDPYMNTIGRVVK